MREDLKIKKLKTDIISAGEVAVKELIKVAKEDIIKYDADDDLAADRLKNAAATKKLAIFDAFEILNRIEAERAILEEKPITKETFTGFAEKTRNKTYDYDALMLMRVVENCVPSNVLKTKNKAKSWKYGYDEKYDIVIISKNGTIGEVYDIQGLRIAIPSKPKEVYSRHNKWFREEMPKDLSYLKTIFDWQKKDSTFKNKWVNYVEKEFIKRDEGYWFTNDNKATYITGSHYMYLQWSKIDIGYPEFRESNRLFYIFWEACKADKRCFGMCYLKNRRSGFSFMSSSESVNQATITRDARVGVLSKTGGDAKKMFTDKIVPISLRYPFFF